jgi:predicted LPLAT superfamily acyltransferase
MRVCAIVPSYNHVAAIGGVIARLRAANLPVFIIDDGSAPKAAAVLTALHAPEHGVVVHRLDANRGKGGAVMAGFALARAAGFSHAVQVDADGQHDLDALPALLKAARGRPEALVTGRPLFDDSVPRSRRIGRWVTHVWVWIETLSFQVRDSMCGFRVYPLEATAAVLRGARPGQRMDFDPEIMVRLAWAGTPVVAVTVRVIYPPDNTSNFDPWRDNLRISWMHTRLVVLMLPRIPALLARRARGTRHWADLQERGGIWGLRITAAAYRVLGRRGCLAMLVPVVAFFFVTGRQQRSASYEFLSAALERPPALVEQFRHFLGFAARTLDVFIGWVGGIPGSAIQPENAAELEAMRDDPRGALLIASHHGNAELSRAVLDKATRERLTVLVHTRHAVRFNEMLQSACPEAAVNLLEVTEIGPETAVVLRERLARGEWVVIAGDRTPVGGSDRVSRVPFLGRSAPFPQGPWILAALLACPVRLLFCRRTGSGWTLSVERFADRIVLPRGNREAALTEYAARYAEQLEAHAREEPFQWHNFFDFWAA